MSHIAAIIDNILNEVIPDLYVLRLIMEHMVLDLSYHIESWWLPSLDRTELSTNFEAIWIHNWQNMQQCIPLLLCWEQCWNASYSTMRSWLTPD